MEALRNSSGFLGGQGNLLADLTLVVQILFYLVLCAGVTVQLTANKGKPHLYKWHDRLQAPVVLLNLLFIIFVMIPTFAAVAGSATGNFSKPPTWVPMLHGTLGLLAEGLAIYCLLAGFKILPRKIGMLRYWMWAAFVLWTVTILFGIGVYLVFYTGGGVAADTQATVTGPDADIVAEHDESPALEQPTPEAVAEHAEEVAETVEEHAEELVEPQVSPETVEEQVEEPTAEPEPATPTPTPEQATPQVERLGILRISDGQVHSDKVTLEMKGVTPPDNGFVYEAWLQGETAPPLSLGVLALNGDAIRHEFVDSQGRNLLTNYNAMIITLEPANDSDPAPSGVVTYSGQIPPEVMSHVRHVVAAFPTSPDGDGLAFNALSEAGLILQQIEAQAQSVADNDLTNLHIHAETTLNILEGSGSPDYGDRDSDGETYNPGDGFGLLTIGDDTGYLVDTAKHATLAAEAPGASDEVKLHAKHVNIASANALDWAGQLQALELQILQVDTPANAADLVAQASELANALLEGLDANGDGQIAPIPGEGSIRTMYQHGQLMGSIEIFPSDSHPIEGSPQSEPTPTSLPQPTATTAPPTPTPTPELISEHNGE